MKKDRVYLGTIFICVTVKERSNAAGLRTSRKDVLTKIFNLRVTFFKDAKNWVSQTSFQR